MEIENTNVGVVILTYNDWQDTLTCLERVHNQSSPPKRVIVCDNGSGNKIADRILSDWTKLAATHSLPEPIEVFGDDNTLAPLTLLRREENEGVSGGMNAALRLLLYDQNCQAFWLMHNDALPETYALAAFLRHCSDVENVGIIGSTLLHAENDLLECAAGGTWSRWTGNTHMLDQGMERHALSDLKDINAKLDFIDGASCFILRTVVESIGLYDERFCQFYEDVEFSLRAKQAGFKLIWAPGALVRHKGPLTRSLTPVLGVTEEPALTSAADYLYVRNRFYLLKRERPWALPFAMITLPLPLSMRLFRGQSERLSLVLKASRDGAAGRMNKPDSLHGDKNS